MGIITNEINLDDVEESKEAIDLDEIANSSEATATIDIEETSASDGLDTDDDNSHYKYDESTAIKEIEVKNFKCIGDVVLKFDESPIISLTGNSDVGKTSIIHGLAVLIYNAYSQHQRRWIKTGKVGFGVRMQLNDGTVISRIKSVKGDIYHMSDLTGEYHFDKLDTSTSVPTVIKDKLGCMIEKETREFVNIRTYKEQMLFVTTPASTTYKVIYGALNVDYITKSVKMASMELNELREKDRRNQILIDDTLTKLKTLKIVDTEVLEKIKERIKVRAERVKKLHEAVEGLKEYRELNAQVEVYKDIENIKDIDTDKITEFKKIVEDNREVAMYEMQLERYKEVENASTIEVERFGRLKNCYANIQDMQAMQGKVKVLEEVENTSDIGNELVELSKVFKTVKENRELNELLEKSKTYEGIETIKEIRHDANEGMKTAIEVMQDAKRMAVEFNQKLAEFKMLEKQLEETGVKVAVCPKCGTDIYM